MGPFSSPPLGSSGLLTPEDEALLAAMSLVGRSRSRSSPANRRLPRGGSGLPPQHGPPSQLRRAVSIDPRVEARAVEKRSAERLRGTGEGCEWENRAGGSDKDEGRVSGETAAGQSPMRTAAELSEKLNGAVEMHDLEQEGSERGARSDKRLKRVEGESAGAAAAAAQAWRQAQLSGSGRLEREPATGADKEVNEPSGQTGRTRGDS